MAEIKKGIKLIRYGYALKLNSITALFFLVIGVLMLCIGESGILLAAIYILLAPTMLIQLESTLLYSGMAAASPERRMLEIYFPDFMTIITGVLGCMITIGGSLFWANKRPESAESCTGTMLVSSIVVAIMLIYFGAAYKYFITSVLMFCLGLVIGISGGVITWRLASEYFTMAGAVIACLVIIAVGIVISGLLRRLFYRKQISPLAGGFSLRKAMQ